jgi:hypothetical protein
MFVKCTGIVAIILLVCSPALAVKELWIINALQSPVQVHIDFEKSHWRVWEHKSLQNIIPLHVERFYETTRVGTKHLIKNVFIDYKPYALPRTDTDKLVTLLFKDKKGTMHLVEAPKGSSYKQVQTLTDKIFGFDQSARPTNIGTYVLDAQGIDAVNAYIDAYNKSL